MDKGDQGTRVNHSNSVEEGVVGKKGNGDDDWSRGVVTSSIQRYRDRVVIVET